ncbi:MAG: tRNA threonylcarbamoyladenosine biosynthesis protein TsaB [Verrucomicrobia bacterium]|jgi:tRNA threonylcarbamoyladenosine biosynthesis protein TsaB|nr:MAG: tRNA threonylcarbamoyladenosine biosynthesis protein TsaB [Verrucomicrobiota bacterium]
MSSLRQLLAAHGPLLLIDAASARIQVGCLSPDQPTRWAGSDEESGVGIFRCLEELALPPAEAGAFVYCDGPGSVLGIRTVAMALRTWGVLTPRPVFAYHSLALVAQALNRPNATIIADARREAWHCITLNSGLRRVPTAELTGELVMPAGFRHWSALPAGVTPTPYSLADLLPLVADRDLFRATDAPDAFLHEEPSYATWTPQVHRAP